MLPPLTGDGLTIEAADASAAGGQGIRLTWRGRSAARNPSEILVPYFRTVLQAALDQGGTAIEMHFESLEHFNSSTVTALIHLIQDARARQVPLAFVYDQGLKWQKLSFDAMRVFIKSDGLLQMRSI